MELRHQRNVPALSAAECDLLRTKKVAVIGCGGLGGYLIELLTRVGIGSIRAVDGDVFEETNLNRQLLSVPDLLGCAKAEAAAARIRTLDPDIRVEAVPVFLDESNAAQLIADCDVVLDALDSIPARKCLAKACADAGIPLVYGAIAGWVAQAAVCLPGDNLMNRLYPAEAVIKDKSVLSFTPALCAAVQTSLCVKLLVGQPVEHDILYYYDLLNPEFEQIPLL